MKFNVESAKKSGYSDQEILDHLSKKDPSFKVNEAKKAGYSDSEILNYLNEKQLPSKTRSKISAPIKGIIKGSQGLNPFAARGPISPRLGERITEEALPTRSEDEPLVRAGKLVPIAAMGPEGILAKAAQVLAGTVGGEIAKDAGLGELGQSIAEGGSMGIPGLAKGIGQKAFQAFKGTPTKLASGLSEIQATKVKRPEFGSISKERQSAVIDKLNKEASALAKKSIEKHVPIIKEIESGVNFENKFAQDFGKIEQLAQKSNPRIDITPLNTFLRDSGKKYINIPSPHPEAKKIMQEVRAFINNPKDNLHNLMKIYRSNNKKLRSLYETARLKGSQQEYADFLVNQNKSIAESFRKTLPEDSSWMKMFDQANKEYGQFQNAKKVTNQLKGFLSETPTKGQVTKLADDVKTQQKLALSMGKEGAQEVVEISKDLKKSIEALKKIPRSTLSKFDAAIPLYFLIPWAGKFLGVAKSLAAGRYFYGYFLSTPSRRKAYKQALDALLKEDLNGYKKALAPVMQELQSEKD